MVMVKAPALGCGFKRSMQYMHQILVIKRPGNVVGIVDKTALANGATDWM
jgi:hypothetical protein